MYSRFSAGERAARPPLIVLERELADEPLERRNARFVLGQHTGGGRVAVERTGVMLGNPDADQVAADVVSFGEPVEGLAGQIVLDDLPLELDRIAAVLGHGLSPRKPGRNSLIRVTAPVHPVGCTPPLCPLWARSSPTGH